MNRVIILIILSLSLVMIINTSGAGQHLTDLTDREILMKLIEKFDNLEKAVLRIEANSDITRNKVIAIDREMYRNSIEVSSLSEDYDRAVARWNALLGLFVVFILGIFAFMWRRSYSGKMDGKHK